jgi:hypothetical protein
MSNEEMNKKMEFIVEHQAKFAVEIEIVREVQAAESKLRNEQNKRLSDGLIGLVDIVGSLTRAQIGADGRIDSLAESQKRTDESLKRLSEAQARTEESLNILLNTVERHIHGNGGPANPS